MSPALRWQLTTIVASIASAVVFARIVRNEQVRETESHVREATESVRQAREQLEAAHVTEMVLRRQLAERHAQDSAAWAAQVVALRTASREAIEAALVRVARRARAEVAERVPEDSGSSQDSACTVTLSCAAAAGLAANDSLLRLRLDSAGRARRIDSAACSTAVASVRLERDSVALGRLQPRPWWRQGAAWKGLGIGAGLGIALGLGAAL